MNYINKIFCAKAEDLLIKFPDECFDLTITSPPYDKLRDYHGFSIDFELIISQLYRTTKNGGIVVWIVGDSVVKRSETGNSFRQALMFLDAGFLLHDTMIYEKAGNAFPSRNRYNQSFEYMFVFSKGKPKTTNLIKDHKNKWAGTSTFGNPSNRKKDGSLNHFGKRTIKDYSVRGNIWRYATGHGYGQSNTLAFKHPATFPEKLVEDHIISWSNDRDLVFDPMCGSGTTLRIAKKLNRNYIGIDISKEYCELSEKLLSEI